MPLSPDEESELVDRARRIAGRWCKDRKLPVILWDDVESEALLSLAKLMPRFDFGTICGLLKKRIEWDLTHLYRQERKLRSSARMEQLPVSIEENWLELSLESREDDPLQIFYVTDLLRSVRPIFRLDVLLKALGYGDGEAGELQGRTQVQQSARFDRMRLNAGVHVGSDLSTRQVEILQLIADGHGTSPVIAAHLHLSIETVKSHRRRIIEKLGAREIAHAVAIGIRTGVIS